MKQLELVRKPDEFKVSTATFDPDRIYRYTLTRVWGPLYSNLIMFCLLNPSTADETVLDPTLRRVMNFSKDWGYDGFVVTNLFGLRSTDPQKLYGHSDPIGPENNAVIAKACLASRKVMVGWGSHGGFLNRDKEVLDLLTQYHDVWCLKKTKDDKPGHPLYLAAKTKPSLFRLKTSKIHKI
jgi:hypothetical protein